MNVNRSYGIGMYNLWNNMYQGNLSLQSNRLNKNLFTFTSNKSQNQQMLGEDGVRFVNSLKSASKTLSSSLKELSGPAFSNRAMVSSNTDVMTVGYSGNRPSSVGPMNVKIDQIAAGQLNEGTRMSSSAAYGGSSGANRFAIESGGKTTQLSINVAAGDTNKAVQQKMADAINNAGIGIKASVETDSATNASMLRIESTKTGSNPKNSFSVADITGGLVAQTGANDIAAEGRDAIYSINGGLSRTSQTNTVNLGNGVSATFKKASEDEVGISRGKDANIAKSQVENLVNSYNDLYAESVQRTFDPKSQNLASKLLNVSKTYSSSLSSIGIGFDSDGRMTLDAKKLDQAAQSGKLEQFFTENSNRNFGFTNQLGKLSDNVSRNTSNFVSSALFGSSMGENFAYSSFGNLVQYNYLNSGSIFDYLY